MELLQRLLDLILPPRPTELLVRSLSVDDFISRIRPQLITFEGTEITTLLSYKDPEVQAAILEAKFHGSEKAQKLLGTVLSEYLNEFSSEEAALTGTVVLLPIPLSPARLRSRGYNQVERICRAAKSDLPINTTTLQRIRDTAAQTTLTRDKRLTNMSSAFASASCDPHTTYVLIDDVTTTGATLITAAATLRHAGAEHILPLALAH